MLGGLGIHWKAPAFCRDFLGRAPVVMTFRENGMDYAHGIGWCPEATRFLTNGSGGFLAANEDWSQVCAWAGDPEGALALGAICARFAAFDGLLLHGALVEYRGEGILFTGPSGIGKTTQAELWQAGGGTIINGDKVLLRWMDGAFYGCGLPWKGSSPYCLSRNVPLRAIVALRQGEENHIQPLGELEAMEYVLPHIFLPRWDEKAYLRALETVDRLLTQVELQLLRCRPEAQAVAITKSALGWQPGADSSPQGGAYGASGTTDVCPDPAGTGAGAGSIRRG